MWVTVVSITVGLIVRLINKQIINTDVFENCMNVQEEEEDTEMVSVSSYKSDLSGVSGNHHVHVLYTNVNEVGYY